MNKPGQFFAFLCALGAVVFGLSLLTQNVSVQFGAFDLSYYKPAELLGTLWPEDGSSGSSTSGAHGGDDPLNLDAELAVDSTDLALSTADSASIAQFGDSATGTPSISALPSKLSVPPTALDTMIQVVDIMSFAPFFEQLQALRSGERSKARIIHYGDSQLEGDRITMQLRDHFQKNYGGNGFGYVALAPLVAPSSLAFNNQEGLARKTVFGRRDTSIKDMHYGHLGSFSQLEPGDSGYVATTTFKRRKWGYSRARAFATARMHVEALAPMTAEIFVEDTLYSTRIFPAGEWTLALDVPSADEFSMRLKSELAARVYGISFESPTGVQVDNVAMRGASGMIFRKMDALHFQTALEREEYSLIILQYGGNAVPYLKDEAHAQRFARALGRQIDRIQSLYPDCSILFIGPSDMAMKEGLNMISYPLIPALKTALRNEVMSRGGGYWDLYDVMGGEGSMVQWVDAEPPLAVKDYVHFTPQGASRVGKRLVGAFEELEQRYTSALAEIEAERQRIVDSTAAAQEALKLQQGTGAQSGAQTSAPSGTPSGAQDPAPNGAQSNEQEQ